MSHLCSRFQWVGSIGGGHALQIVGGEGGVSGCGDCWCGWASCHVLGILVSGVCLGGGRRVGVSRARGEE